MLKLLLLFAILALATGSNGNIRDPSELSLTERLLTLFMAQKNPEYKNIPHLFHSIFSFSLKPLVEYSAYDAVFLEIGSFVLLSRHWGERNPLPEINWRYGFSMCGCWFFDCHCVDRASSWTSTDSKFLGTDTIKMKTDWTPKTFVQRLTIGNYTWSSPQATTVEEDFIQGKVVTCVGSWIKLENVSFVLGGTYHFNETLGIQVDNLSFEFDAANMSYGTDGCISKDFGQDRGNATGPEHWQFAGSFWEEFETYRRVILTSMTTRFNCFLSNGKYVPPPPGEEDGWGYDKECGYKDPMVETFAKMSVIQMFQMMGAASHD